MDATVVASETKMDISGVLVKHLDIRAICRGLNSDSPPSVGRLREKDWKLDNEYLTLNYVVQGTLYINGRRNWERSYKFSVTTNPNYIPEPHPEPRPEDEDVEYLRSFDNLIVEDEDE